MLTHTNLYSVLHLFCKTINKYKQKKRLRDKYFLSFNCKYLQSKLDIDIPYIPCTQLGSDSATTKRARERV